jgi:hypothetical protein
LVTIIIPWQSFALILLLVTRPENSYITEQGGPPRFATNDNGENDSKKE